MTTPSMTEFETLRGRAFRVDGTDEALALQVVVPLPQSPRDGGGFRLEFTGAPTSAVQQGLYRLTGDGAVFDIFIVPVARDADATTFEAIFN